MAEIIGFLRAWLMTIGSDPDDIIARNYTRGTAHTLVSDALALARALNRTIKL